MKVSFPVLMMVASILVLNACKTTKSNTSKNVAIAEFGHYLFFDPALSSSSKLSCSSCHQPEMAFTDGYRKSLNHYAEELASNTSTLLNLNNRTIFNWADSSRTLFAQMDRPLYAQHPVEMDWNGKETIILSRIKQNPLYSSLYTTSFAKPIEEITAKDVREAIATYILTLQSRNSKYDFFRHTNDSSQLTLLERQGMILFFSKQIGCSDCHGGQDFFEPTQGSVFARFTNYNCKTGSVEAGLAKITHNPQDSSCFRIPTLRNVALTAPYLHDGATFSMTEVLQHHQKGGRTQANQCDNQLTFLSKDKRFTSFLLTKQQQIAILSFLETLTDTTYLKNPLYRNPFSKMETLMN